VLGGPEVVRVVLNSSSSYDVTGSTLSTRPPNFFALVMPPLDQITISSPGARAHQSLPPGLPVANQVASSAITTGPAPRGQLATGASTFTSPDLMRVYR
jgi:hypothetical protein